MKQFLLLIPFLTQLGFYDLQSYNLEGIDIDFHEFTGKKVLIVNTAMNSQFVSQYYSLEQLYESHKDSLIIIAYPSNSFNNEPNDDPNDLRYLIDSVYHPTFTLGEISEVKSDQMTDVYRWLTSQNLTDSTTNFVASDFQKYLIDSQGKLVGVFAGNVDPMSPELKNAIDSTYN